MTRGKFVVFEGINGSGKDTQYRRLWEHVVSSGKAVPIFCTGEPNNFDEHGKKARALLSADGDPYANKLEAVSEFTSNRINHNGIFVPLLERGVHVFCVRYYHSTFAFQGAQGISYGEIAQRSKGVLVPDLTLIYDLPAQSASERLERRIGEDRRKAERIGDERRKFDANLEFLESVRQKYLELPQVLPSLLGDNSVRIIDGAGSIDEIFDQTKESWDLLFKMS